MKKKHIIIVYVFCLIQAVSSDETNPTNIEKFISGIKSYYYLSSIETTEIENLLQNSLQKEYNDISGNYIYYDLNSKLSKIGIKITFENDKYVFSEIKNDLSTQSVLIYREITQNCFLLENSKCIYNTTSGLFVLSKADIQGYSNFYSLEQIIVNDIRKIDFINPYNLKMGMLASEICNLKKSTKMDMYEYFPKENNSFFDRYILWIDETLGLYYIKTIGYDIYDKEDLNKQFEVIYNELLLTFGKPSRINENSYSWYNNDDKKVIWLFVQDCGKCAQIVLEYSYVNKEISY